MAPTRIFISSLQQELAAERRAVKDFVHNDALLGRHFEVFLFEDLPARDQRADAVGTRSESNAAPVTPAIPRAVVTEAIVNAVAHRDYASAASVRVELFADRLEVSNPGTFPPSLVGVDLSKAHASLPHNPLLAEPLFLAHYIEKAGTGILDMIERCNRAGLPSIEYKPTAG